MTEPSLRALVVDDSVITVSKISAMLGAMGHTVVATARTGAEALDAYREHLPDIVTMDITMPDMDGVAATTRIIAEFPGARIVMVTSHGQEKMVLAAINAGARGYVLKPIRADKLQATINQAAAAPIETTLMHDAFIPGPARPEYWETLFDAVPFPIYVVDTARLELINVNRSMRARSGASTGDRCYQAIYGRDRPCIFCAIADLSSTPQPIGSSVTLEYFNDQDDRWYQLQESLISWFDGRIAKYSIAVDISQLKETQNALAEAHAELSLKSKELERLVATDEVTGLSNRRRVYDILALESERTKRYGSPLSVFLVDIDKFKLVNDGFGHLVGDRVLQGVAQILKQGVRKVDTVGRWGGEEFIVICPNTSAADALKLAEKLRSAINGDVFSPSGTMTCSFGVAQLQDGESAESLFRRADLALYRAKEAGRDRVELDP